MNRNQPVHILRAYEPRDRAMRYYAETADLFGNAEQMHWLVANEEAAKDAHWAGLLCLKAYEAEWTNPTSDDLVPCEDGQDTLPHIAEWLRAAA